MYRILIEGKVFTTKSKKAYNCMAKGLEIINWLKDNDNDFVKAAIKFDFHEQALRKKIHKLGYNPLPRKMLSPKVVEKAIKIHLETGSIKSFAKRYNITKLHLGARMRMKGYSLRDRAYVKKIPIECELNHRRERRLMGLYGKILYNPILSYHPTFEMPNVILWR